MYENLYEEKKEKQKFKRYLKQCYNTVLKEPS